jgi:transcription elongation factor Elf1
VCYNIFTKQNIGEKMEQIKRFDMDMKPRSEKWYLTPLAYLLSFPTVWRRKLKVNKINMEGLKPPYVLLCTHHAFIDFKVTTAAIYPNRANYIVAIDGFIKRENLLRNVGCICKRKFTNDYKLVKHIKYALDKLGNIVAIYPEARYSICGTNAILPESLAKLVKKLKKPVVVLNMHGNYLSQPVWNLKQQNVKLTADMTQIISKEELEQLDVNTIKDKIDQAFIYDEYKYQKDNGIKIKYKKRAEGLEKVLYYCPNCNQEHQIFSKNEVITCHNCQKSWTMQENGSLLANQGLTEFSHIPDWYEFQRVKVRAEIEAGTYAFEDEVYVESLPNADGYIPLGKATLKHDLNGFLLEGSFDGKPFKLEKPPLSMYGLHIEFNYFDKGDCIDLSTLDDTYYIYPQNHKNVVTKLHFATEELYKIHYEALKSSDAK